MSPFDPAILLTLLTALEKLGRLNSQRSINFATVTMAALVQKALEMKPEELEPLLRRGFEENYRGYGLGTFWRKEKKTIKLGEPD